MSALRFAPRNFTRNFSSTPKAQISRITLVGRLGTAPESFTLSSGKEIIRYVVGTNRGYGESQQTAWWKVGCFADPSSKIGEKILSLPKGTQVYIEGDVWNSLLEDGNGNKSTNISITQSNIQILKRPNTALANESEEEHIGKE